MGGAKVDRLVAGTAWPLVGVKGAQFADDEATGVASE